MPFGSSLSASLACWLFTMLDNVCLGSPYHPSSPDSGLRLPERTFHSRFQSHPHCGYRYFVERASGRPHIARTLLPPRILLVKQQVWASVTTRNNCQTIIKATSCRHQRPWSSNSGARLPEASLVMPYCFLFAFFVFVIKPYI